MRLPTRRVCRSFIFLFAASVACSAASAGDWTHWRGPHQNGVSDDTGLPDKFSIDPKAPNSNLIWSAPYPCRSTPVVMGGRVFILNGAGSGLNEGERFMCLDAATGEKIWEDKFNVFHSGVVSSRIGWTSPCGDPETGYVYMHGTQGYLRCYDRDGKVVWQHSLTEEYGRVTGYGGRISSPIVADGVVVIGMVNGSWGDFARGANRFVAFDKKTGQVAWWATLETPMKGTYYSNPVVATIGEQRLLVTGAADGGLHAIQPRTGKLVWSYHFGGNVINGSPIVDGNLVYCSHGEENEDNNELGRLVCVDASQIVDGRPKLVWEVVGIKFGYTSPLLHDGKLYIANDSGRLFTYDAKTGKPVGRPFVFGRLSRGSPVLADGKIYLFDVNGHFHILKPGSTGIKELHEQEFRGETNGSPAVADGRVYFGTHDRFFCIGTKAGKAGPAPASEPALRPGKDMAQMQVAPAEVVLAPGETAEFGVHFFDANGDPIVTQTATPKIDWAVLTPPKTPAGLQPPPLKGMLVDGNFGSAKFTADAATPGQQGYVSATSGKMTARVRIRVAPRLPYKQDFEKVPVGATPGGWINTTGKFEVADLAGNKVLKKLANNPNPVLARANAFITVPESKDYTIQADVSAEMVRNGLPDIGIVNSRYTLMLDGKIDPRNGKRRLRIASWEALPRVDYGIVFDWKPDTWYTLRLAIEYSEKTARLRGKVWQRGQEEPKDWTIEFEDPSPNREGSAGLYAYVSNILDTAPGSACYFDNVGITPVKK